MAWTAIVFGIVFGFGHGFGLGFGLGFGQGQEPESVMGLGFFKYLKGR